MSDKNRQNRSDKEWSGRTGGKRWMQRSLIGMFRHIPPALVYPVIWFWVLLYIIPDGAGRRGIWRYWTLQEQRQKRQKSRAWKAWNFYLTYLEFGKVIMDRFASYSGRKISVSIDGQEQLESLVGQAGGLLVLGTHIGNQELAGYTLPIPRPMDALVYMGDTETVNENREQAFAKRGLKIIPVRADGSHVLEMYNALSEGHILALQADRLFTETKSIRIPILGAEAAFAEGPFRIAVAEGVPVYSLYMMRDGADRYTFYVRELSDGTYTGSTRRERIDELAHRYVETMEQILDRYPRQWFHFYEFWK